MASKYDLAIFDLDGTLLDTSSGIFNSVRYAEKKMNLPPILDSELRLFVGPPPTETYQKLYGLTKQDALTATKYHREYAKEKGIYEFVSYEGLEKTLYALKEGGIRLAVATLKSEKIAKTILQSCNLSKYFDVIVGMNEQETMTKKDTIKIAMEKTASIKAVMIGDSQYDAIGAKEALVSFIGVTYGFGFRDKDDVAVFDNVGIVGNPIEFYEIIMKN